VITPIRALTATVLAIRLMANATAMAPSAQPQAVPSLIDLSTVSELRDRFNHDSGATRLVLLLSPT